MKKTDIAWILGIAFITVLLIIPVTRNQIASYTIQFPYLMGFIKTAILASLGEGLARRISTGFYYQKPGNLLRFVIWGFLGMGFVLFFHIFASGIGSAIQNGLLPTTTQTTLFGRVVTAFWISFWMNLIFAPTFMFFHRVTDGFIDVAKGSLKALFKVPLQDVITTIDMKTFVGFVILRTIPLFWIPAHTITFLLPENFRVIMAGYLSIALGLILTIAKRKKH